MRYFLFSMVLLLSFAAAPVWANPSILRAAQAKAREENLTIAYSCNTCHDEVPTRRNNFKLSLTEEGKKWRKPKPKCACAVQ